MGGGSSGGATPTTPPGYTGGSVMDYTPPAYSASPVQGGYTDWSKLGTAFNQFGAGIANQPTPNYMSGAPSLSQANIPGGSPQTNLIPETGGGSDIMAALMRLLGGLG